MGYSRAGFDEIVGVDIEPQPDYPFEFIQLDLTVDDLPYYPYPDLVHASPPCQRFSTATLDGSRHPDLIGMTRSLLEEYDRPYVIENVPAAPIRKDLMLCGSMFGLQVQRHRHFELTFPVAQPKCSHVWLEGRPWTVVGTGGGGKWKHSWKPGPIGQWRELMGMPWVTNKRGIAEAIPPAYTEYIGRQFIDGVAQGR
jgi:DNA (cytosine-5)-methyltransferase 1